MAKDDEDAIAKLAVDLNEDAKAGRKKASGSDASNEGEKPEEANALDDLEVEIVDEGTAIPGSDDEHPAAMEIETSTEDFDPEPEEAVQALREAIMSIVKALPDPWHKIPAEGQVDIFRAVENASTECVRTLVEMMAARGQEPVRVLLKKVAMDGSKVAISGEAVMFASENPDKQLLMLNHAIGKHVMLTRATVDDYNQGPDAEPDADEPEMDFEADFGDDDTEES